jgi:hypothetical protein
MEVVIRVFASMGKKLTKNQAREVIAKAKIKKELLENLPRETISYRELAEKLSAVYSCIDT